MVAGIIAVSIILVALLLWLCFKSKSTKETLTKEKSLYDRLGGVYAIAAVIDHFSNALINNPVVGKNSPNPMLRDWSRNQLDRLPGLKFMRTLWVSDITGGPFKFVSTKPGKCPLSLENVHKNLKISPEEFDAVAQELSRSMDHFSVPKKEQQEVLSAFNAHKGEVTQGYFLNKGKEHAQITC